MSSQEEKVSLRANDILSEAFTLLKSTSQDLWFIYCIGTFPFLVSLMYFVTDMSYSISSNHELLFRSVIMSIAFIWMKGCQALFAAGLYEQRTLSKIEYQWRDIRIWFAQGIIQVWSWPVLIIASLLMLPFAWCCAFFQNAAVFSKQPLSKLIKTSMEQTQWCPGQNHALIAYISIFSLFIFLNIATSIYFVFYIAEVFFNIESDFSLSISTIFNTTYIFVCLALSFLVIDPLIRAVYAVRCFYSMSTKTGLDLKVRLKSISALSLYLLLLIPNFGSYADEKVQQNQLTPIWQNSLQKAKQQPYYRWRRPKVDQAQEDSESWSIWIVKKTFEWANSIGQSFKKPMKKFFKWLGSWFEGRSPKNTSSESSFSWSDSVQIISWFFLCILSVGLLIIIIKHYRLSKRSNIKSPTLAQNVTSSDLERDDWIDISTDSQRWKELAEQCAKAKDWKKAIRAYFLYALSNLSEHQWIELRKTKSNRDYKSELQSRLNIYKVPIDDFGYLIHQYESAWFSYQECSESKLLQTRQSITQFFSHLPEISKQKVKQS